MEKMEKPETGIDPFAGRNFEKSSEFLKIPASDIPPWERPELIGEREYAGNDIVKQMPEKILKIPASDIPPWERSGDSLMREEALPKYGFLPRSGGEWSGEPGNSIWIPDREKVPENPKTNPEGKTWGEILDKYGIDGIDFKDGEPDFSEISKGTVEIDDFSDNRDDNFASADETLAKQRGCTAEEVRQWRKENHYTWHECSDMKTMQKVPTEVHGNIPHEGGISAKKRENENG
jgi:hypothetical protein